MTPDQIPTPEPGANPALSDDGTHIATPKLAFIETDEVFRLCQFFMPCDSTTHAPEWREVPAMRDPASNG